MRILIFFLFLVLFPFSDLFSQKAVVYSNPKSKAVKHFEKAMKFYEARRDAEAMEELLKAKEKDPLFVETYLFTANIYFGLKNYDAAINDLKKIIEINPGFEPTVYLTLGNIELIRGAYKDAGEHLKVFLSIPKRSPKDIKLAEKNLKTCEFANSAMSKPVPFDPKNLGPNLNSQHYEYFPALTADDQTMLFTRNERRPDGNDFQEDFYISQKTGNEWSRAINIGEPINSLGNEGAPTLSSNGQILIFAACERRDSYGGCDIYYSRKTGNEWTPPKNMGPPINTPFWDTQPSFSSDGKTLYFISNRKGGFGEGDIYYSVIQQDGTWSIPENLGALINTPGHEESPFIHPDTKTLYYASDGHSGMGGMDIYFSRKDDQGKWQTPVNIGYPINTFNDENSLMVNGAGNLAYFASDRTGGSGMLDIYSFELYEAARPEKVTYFKGKVFDKETNNPLGAKFELIDLATGKSMIESNSNSATGQFIVSLPAEKNYALNVSKPGYLFYSENFSLTGNFDASKPFLKDVPLNPIKTGEKVVLKNVFFETNSYTLKEESKIELQKLVGFLEKNSNVKIEISGHTDNVGDKQKNQVLSENRSKSVLDFLIGSKVDPLRLTNKGFGDTKPIDNNETEQGRANNRRTEFTITGK